MYVRARLCVPAWVCARECVHVCARVFRTDKTKLTCALLYTRLAYATKVKRTRSVFVEGNLLF